MGKKEVIAILNNLIQTCKEGQEGFRSAAEHISNSEFRRLFNIFSQQRAQFVSELQAEVHRLGGNPKESTGALGAINRSWTNFKAMITKSEEASIVAQCQQGEEAAVNSYQEALKADLPLDVQYVVKRQYMDIKDAYDRMRILQRAA
jgi:uncharacterized protein (TIGR02284 family)